MAGPIYENDPGNYVDWADFAGAGGGTFTLTVKKMGPGRVASSPAGISCNPGCSASFEEGTVVTLTATPGLGAKFGGWSGGGCSGSGLCLLTMRADVSLEVKFDPPGDQALNYPNPFGRDGTTFAYKLRQPGDVLINIYTRAGELVKTLRGPGKTDGYNETFWDCRNEGGQEVANGIYHYQIISMDAASRVILSGTCTKKK